MNKYTIEYTTGNVSMVDNNLLFADWDDMKAVEEWEYRLSKILKQPYVVAYRIKDNKIVYSIFTNMRGKKSNFKYENGKAGK